MANIYASYHNMHNVASCEWYNGKYYSFYIPPFLQDEGWGVVSVHSPKKSKSIKYILMVIQGRHPHLHTWQWPVEYGRINGLIWTYTCYWYKLQISESYWNHKRMCFLWILGNYKGILGESSTHILDAPNEISRGGGRGLSNLTCVPTMIYIML